MVKSRRDVPQVRSGGAVVVRALAAGVVVGGLLGMLALVPDLWRWRNADPALGVMFRLVDLPLAAAIGAGVGVLCSSVAVLAWWLAVAEREGDGGRRGRVVAAVGPVVVIVVLSVVVWRSLTWAGVFLALLAGAIAYFAVPVLAYVRTSPST